MNRNQENRMRADFARHYQYSHEITAAVNAGHPVSRTIASRPGRIASKYTRLLADDDRREAWRHLVGVAEAWDRQPEEMFELVDDLEHHHAAGKPLISDVHLRNHQQARHLYITRTHEQHPHEQERESVRARTSIVRSR